MSKISKGIIITLGGLTFAYTAILFFKDGRQPTMMEVIVILMGAIQLK